MFFVSYLFTLLMFLYILTLNSVLFNNCTFASEMITGLSNPGVLLIFSTLSYISAISTKSTESSFSSDLLFSFSFTLFTLNLNANELYFLTIDAHYYQRKTPFLTCIIRSYILLVICSNVSIYEAFRPKFCFCKVYFREG